MKDMLNAITVKKVIASISGAGDDVAIVGAIIDHQGYESATYIINTGVLADGDATFTVLLEEGDDSGLSDNAGVADGHMISQSSNAPETDAAFAFGDDGEVRTLGYRGAKRYTRMTITPANNTGAWPIGVVCVLGHRRSLPFSQPAS